MTSSAQAPSTSQHTLDVVGEIGRNTIPNNVFMIRCPRTNNWGSGFLLSNGYIVTNNHVVQNIALDEVHAISSQGKEIRFSACYPDKNKELDLILLKPSMDLEGGLHLDLNPKINVGECVHTWGFPAGYAGPTPLLSVGYLSGFTQRSHGGKAIKHLVINGAFNRGNSGGALFKSGDNKVIGIVLLKSVPLDMFYQQGIQILEQSKTGDKFNATNPDGTPVSYTEIQIIASILKAYHQDLAQLMIGEAIWAEELANLLRQHNLLID